MKQIKFLKKRKNKFLKFYIGKDENNKNLTFEELYGKEGEDWNNNNWRKDNNEIWTNYSTYNPKSKWDWYEVGGRWNKAIRNNQCLSKSIRKDFVPFAFVDEFGNWHERAKMHWWAITSHQKEDDVWEKEFKDAIARYKGYVTLVDCHI